VGIRILARSIEEPLRNIVENAGEDAAVILNQVRAGKRAYGYNAATGEFGDALAREGVIECTSAASSVKRRLLMRHKPQLHEYEVLQRRDFEQSTRW